MHQSHNIPWCIFAEHTEFAAYQPSFPNRPPQLLSRGKPGEAKALNHFVQKFVSTIEEFSKTERQKYRSASEFTFPTSGNLFDFNPELEVRYRVIGNDRHQDIESWTIATGDGNTLEESFRNFDMDHYLRVGVIAMLMGENDMDTLLMLANHPKVPLHTLFASSCWAHEQTSLFRVMETTVSSYLFFNITSATGDLDNGSWKRISWHVNRMYTPSPDWDYPADKITHRQFYPLWTARGDAEALENLRPDYQILHDDLKSDFEMMYKWDMLLREMGMKLPWQDGIVRILKANVGGLNECPMVQEAGKDSWVWPSLFC
jgi:hypothetical protein